MSEDLKICDAQRLVHCFNELITKPRANVTVATDDLLSVQNYLESGVLDNKVRDILLSRAEQRKREERARAEAEAAIAAAAEALKVEEDEEEDQEEMIELDKKCPSSASNISLDAAETGEDASEDADGTIDSRDIEYFPTSNEPRVDFLSFIDRGDAFLMFEEQTFPMDYEIRMEHLGYPLGVAYDEVTQDWLICDRDNHKIVRLNLGKDDLKVTNSTELQNPSAIVIYQEGKSAAILCSADRSRQFSIYLYNLGKPFLRVYASYKDEIYDMKNQMRGLAKSLDHNLISLDLSYHGPKRLKVLKKEFGSVAFELKGAQNPSFIASYRGTVAVSDLGVNRVSIYQLDDRDWDNVVFMPTKVIESTPLSMDRLANESGFAYVSGMQFDTNGFLLIGDAKGRTIKLYDTEYSFLHRVSSNFTMPFMSSFHINSAGDTIILDVHATQKIRYVRLKSIGEILPWMRGSQHSGSVSSSNGSGGMPRRQPYHNSANRRVN